MLSLQFSTLKGGLGDLTCNNNKQESSSSSIEVAAILESVWKKMRLSLSKRPILYQEQVIFSSLGQWTQRTPDDDVSQLFSKKDYNIEEQIEIEQKNFGEIFQLVEPKSPPNHPTNQPAVKKRSFLTFLQHFGTNQLLHYLMMQRNICMHTTAWRRMAILSEHIIRGELVLKISLVSYRSSIIGLQSVQLW